MDSERLKWVAETLIRSSHEGTLVLIEKGRRAIGLEEVDPIMLLYMITSVAQMPYLLTAELKYSHNRDAMAPHQ